MCSPPRGIFHECLIFHPEDLQSITCRIMQLQPGDATRAVLARRAYVNG